MGKDGLQPTKCVLAVGKKGSYLSGTRWQPHLSQQYLHLRRDSAPESQKVVDHNEHPSQANGKKRPHSVEGNHFSPGGSARMAAMKKET